MNEYDKLRIRYARLIGKFQGVLNGLEWWELPDDLKDRINKLKSELETEYDEFQKESI